MVNVFFVVVLIVFFFKVSGVGKKHSSRTNIEPKVLKLALCSIVYIINKAKL